MQAAVSHALGQTHKALGRYEDTPDACNEAIDFLVQRGYGQSIDIGELHQEMVHSYNAIRALTQALDIFLLSVGEFSRTESTPS